MEKSTKWIIGGLVVAGLGLTAYLTRKSWMPKKEGEIADATKEGNVSVSEKPEIPLDPNQGRPNFKVISDSFTDLKKNLGANVKSAGNVVSVKFNSGKNSADFYSNGRIVIGTVGKSGYLMKGSYNDGGKNINIDKADGGYEVSSGSVWGNLLTVLNKKIK